MHSKGRGGSGPKWARAPACVQFPVAVVAIFRARNFLQSTQLYNGGLVSIGKPHAQLSLSPLAVLEFRGSASSLHETRTVLLRVTSPDPGVHWTQVLSEGILVQVHWVAIAVFCTTFGGYTHDNTHIVETY